MPNFLLFFAGFAIVETFILVKVGAAVGPMATIGLCLVTGVVGGWLTRHQWFYVLDRAVRQFEKGQIPADALIDGLFVLIAGVLLLTPGFVTDALGIALLMPPVRALLRPALAARGTRWVVQSRGRQFGGPDGAAGPHGDPFGGFGGFGGTHGFGPGGPGDRPGAPPRQGPGFERTDDTATTVQEVIPPDRAPRPPKRRPPRVINVD